MPADSLTQAFAHCEQLARAHYENFPVGSLLIPKAKRQHVYSIYAFARTADDFADEGNDEPATRLRQLDEWQAQLDECYESRATHPIFIALAHTVKELQLEKSLLSDLLSAFKQDVTKRRYANFSEVLDYCTRSANPVGRLILRLFDYRQPQLDELSDAICTALQLTNFWQDLAVDILKDRVYLPENEMAAAGLTAHDLRARAASPALRQLLKFQVARTRELLMRGKALSDLMSGRLAVELRLTWHGGMRILELIEQQQFDTLAQRPKLNTADKFRLLSRALFAL
ncbi:MAG: squalene synthase HpnC [Acidobacteria bacterium]|nr:squalene synthase HpnC [Acidobacteriota bacterium]